MLTPDDITILNTWKAIGNRWSATAKRIHETVEWCISHRNMKGIEEMDFAFDPTGINPNFGGGPGLPVGKHPVTVTKSEGKPTRDNTGGYLELTCTAFDGPAKGGSIPIRLNVHNTSEAAVRIAKEQLAAICLVTGVGPFQNTQALHDKPFIIEVVPQKDKPNYTEVAAVFDMNGNEPGKQGQGGGAGAGAGAGGGFGGGATGTGNIPPANNGGGNGGFGGNAGGGADQQQQGGGTGGFGGGGGGGGFGGGAGAGAGAGGGGGNGWQQNGGGAGGGGGSPGWGQR